MQYKQLTQSTGEGVGMHLMFAWADCNAAVQTWYT